MNELFDKLILRMAFALLVCVSLILYRYAHYVLFPSSRHQIIKSFFPSKNSADSLHLFSRILGIGIIYSEFYFYFSDGILLAIVDLFIQSLVVFLVYLFSLYIIESIVLFNFEYSDEIVRRKNLPYAIICFSHSISMALLIKSILKVSGESLIVLLFLWLLAMVLIGFASKAYSIFSKLPFNKLLIQKNMALSFSYSGYILGWTMILTSSMDQRLTDIKSYTLLVVTKVLLSLILYPVFNKGLIWLFKIKDDQKTPLSTNGKWDGDELPIGYGTFEGAIFFTSCYLTTVISGQIYFGTFYPV